MWSPKRQANDRTHFSYELMKTVQQGDIVFSYAKSQIIAIGVAQTHCYTFPKPIEFGNAGANWSEEGWKVDVRYQKLENPIRTIDHIDEIRALLPISYSPLKSENGYANQAYLFEIDKPLALWLARNIDSHAVNLVTDLAVKDATFAEHTVESNIQEWEDRVVASLTESENLSATQKEAVILARRGQGRFRAEVMARERECRITGVSKPEHLIASHIKPWRSADNDERLDPENGFMLTPTIDHLFDKGFISFENNGGLILADTADRDAMHRMGIIGSRSELPRASISEDKKYYLDWHRKNTLLSTA